MWAPSPKLGRGVNDDNQHDVWGKCADDGAVGFGRCWSTRLDDSIVGDEICYALLDSAIASWVRKQSLVPPYKRLSIPQYKASCVVSRESAPK